VQIKINNKIYNCQEGETVLAVCKRNEIRIPTLCNHSDLLPSEGICRLCLVKTEGNKQLVTSCQLSVSDGLKVITEDADIERARRINLELLWVDHAGKCLHCLKNGNCELQNLAKEYKLNVFDFVPEIKKFDREQQLQTLKNSLRGRVIDDGNPSIFRDNQYCIDCRRCVKVCRDIQTVEEYSMSGRSIQTNVGTACNVPMDCILCGQCANVCPTAAITEKNEVDKLEELLADKSKIKIFQVAPSVRFTLGEEFGLAPGNFVEEKIPTALRKVGADLVFDTTFSADLTIVEEAHELIGRITKFLQGDQKVKFPMFTSCCPSWVLYVEKYWPEYKEHLSTAKSPQQMLGAMIKTYYAEKRKINKKNISSISVMPCTSKKFEAIRKEMGRDGVQDIDLVVTTRELARFLKKRKIDFLRLENQRFDQSLGAYSGAGLIFGSTGGVMEAALRTAYETLTCDELPSLDFKVVRGIEGIRVAEIVIPKGKCNVKELKIKVAVAHEIRNAKKILEMMKKGECDFHFVEVMACPSGCLGGGGQPLPTNAEIRKKRRDAIYEKDSKLPIRKSHKNLAIKHLYEEFLKEPGGGKSEELLHTGYTDRSDKK
jgi:NADP-reducing hydrogenase subunit HndD